jgi:DNA-binding CsgD family transcriptional regulator
MQAAKPSSAEPQELLPGIIDLLPFGAVFLDESTRIVQCNHLAQAVLARNDGLKISQNTLWASHPASHQRLSQAIASAHTTNRATPTVLSIVRPNCSEPYEVLVTPLRRQPHGTARSGSAAVAVLVSDPNRSAPGMCTRIRQLYGLTASETKIADGLSRGMTVQDLAQQMNVQTNTIRIHLKRVYSKTGTRRQSELIQLVTRKSLLTLPFIS